MSNNEGKTPVVTPQTEEESPRRGGFSSPIGRGSPPTGGRSSSRGNASPRGRGSPHSSPRGRGSPLGPQSRPSGVVSPSAMGVPGQSAFSRYTSPSSSGSGFMPRAQPQAVVHVGGSSSSAPAAAGLQLDGSSPASARKRSRESGINPPPPQVVGAPNPVQCSVCRREFLTPKALFGHMRSHPERGWKGAHPPPAFRAEEEFADLRVQNAAPPEGGGGGGGADEDEEQGTYKVPDLNNPPPPDAEN